MKLPHATVALVRLLAAAAALGGASHAYALGFRNPDQGARATAQGEAFIAQADDASAVYYNPAGLVQLQGTHLTSGTYFLWPSSKYSGVNGRAEMNTFAMLPHLYAATDFGLERWRFGFGANVPFGNVAEYSDSGPFRFSVTEAMLAVFSFSPTVAYQVNDHLSLGVGVNIYYGQTELKRMLPLGFGGGAFQFEGDGVAAGVTVGLLYKFNPKHAVGLVYRSPFEVEFADSARVNGSPIGPSSAHTTIKFPQSVAVGYAFRPTEKLKLEVDIDWTNWDTLNDVVLRWPGTIYDGLTIPFHWQDSFFYQFGAEYQFAERWAARVGYIFSENSVPDRTFSASIPDSDRHVVSAGFGYSSDRFDFDLGYQLSLLVSRTVRGSPDNSFDGVGDADGRWKGTGHALIMTGTLKF